MPCLRKLSSGITVVEIAVASGVIAVGVLAALAASSLVSVSQQLAQQRLGAVTLAESELEQLRAYRDGTAWSSGLGAAQRQVSWHAEKTAGQPPAWDLVLGTETEGVFSVKAEFFDVRRDVSDDITESGGTVDPDTVKATVTVSWTERQRSHQVQVSTYVTNWQQL